MNLVTSLANEQLDAGQASAGGAASAASTRCLGKVVIISEHDYRTARRANMHPLADAFVRLGYQVSFVSVRFSFLSLLKGDSRKFLWDRANEPEFCGNVQCYLWKTAFHPFHPKVQLLNALSIPLYRAYARLPDRFIDEVLQSASFVVVESGLGALLLARARARNDSATIVYLASDELVTVGVHPFVQEQLERCGQVVDQVCIPSGRMAANFTWAGDRVFHVPHGIDPTDFIPDCPNPYNREFNAVSVGSMLFDPDFFIQAARQFPEIEFHVIGAGREFDAPSNVRQYGEMPFRDTTPFIRNASIGIAPYRAAPGCDYLCDTSMKLMQYEYLGIPAVCPTFAAARNPNRFGYVVGDPRSIATAIAAAMERREAIAPRSFLTWNDVARRLLNPRAFPDTFL